MRIHELAKELGVESKSIKEKCTEHGIELPSRNYHLKALTDEQISLMRSALSTGGSPVGTSQTAAAPKPRIILKLTQRHGHTGKWPTAQAAAPALEPEAHPQPTAPPAADAAKPAAPDVSSRPEETLAPEVAKPKSEILAAPPEQTKPEASSSAAAVSPTKTEGIKPEAEGPPSSASVVINLPESPADSPQRATLEPPSAQTAAAPPLERAVKDKNAPRQAAKKPPRSDGVVRPQSRARKEKTPPTQARPPKETERQAKESQKTPRSRLVVPPQKARNYTRPTRPSDQPGTARGSNQRPGGIARRRKPSGWPYRKGQRFRRPVHTGPLRPKQEPIVIEKAEIEPPITIRELSAKFGQKAGDIISRLMRDGELVSINMPVSEETIALLAEEYGIKVEFKKKVDPEDTLAEFDNWEDNPKDLQPRAPIVTFLGHVDHGKTSLLDQIRQTNVTEGEAGGITQHIGAYKVRTGEGREVVFLDTPGHRAFTAMRARGANVTDLVVLVVAADDGVMPQTEEAIDHTRAANVPIVVALNKIDMPSAKADRVKQQLVGHGLTPEEWGGSTICVEVSAITKQGISELIEMLSLEAEMLELSSNPKRPAAGTVLEAQISGVKGTVATVLIQNGTLHSGDNVLCGTAYGRIRAIYDDWGRSLKVAGPATPVEVIGLSGVPEAGDKFYVFEDAQKAKEVALARREKQREASLFTPQHVTLEDLYEQIERGKSKELRIILKADVKGSVEALKEPLEELSTEEVKLRILHSGVGGINESDVLLADASDAVIIGFQVVAEERSRNLAEERGVQIRFYDVIYQVADSVKSALEGMLQPELRETVSGHVEIRRIFRGSSIGSAAGCYVTDGRISRNSHVRLLRDNVVIYSGRIGSLRIEREDVREVREGFECGIKIESYDDIKVGDVIEAYEIHEIARTLDST